MKREDLDSVKPIIQPALEGRDDVASIIEALEALVEEEVAEIEATEEAAEVSADAVAAEVVVAPDVISIADHEAQVEVIRSQLTNDFNRRMESTFFSGQQAIVSTLATGPSNVIEELESAEGTTTSDDEPFTTSDLFTYKETS